MAQIHVNIAYQNMTDDGFDFLACQGLHPEYYFCGDSVDVIERSDIERLKKVAATKQFSSTLHAPFFDLNIGARDHSIRLASFERLIWALETAALLESKLVVMHPGYGPWVLNHNFDQWLNRATPMLEKLASHAGSLGLRIAFENIYDAEPDDLMLLLERVSARNVGICLDIGHFHVFSRFPLQHWLDVMGKHILECHLHDNARSADQHLALGDGKIDYEPLRQWLKSLPDDKMPVLTLELPHRTHVIKSAVTLKNWEI
jgi:sugar phosphate isomerase/epimerase